MIMKTAKGIATNNLASGDESLLGARLRANQAGVQAAEEGARPAATPCICT